MAEHESRQRRQLGHQPHPLDVAVLGVVQVLGVGIEGAERANHPQQHSHRVGVVAEAAQELDEVGVDVGVVADVRGPLVQLFAGREFAFGQEVRHLEE